MAWIKRGVAFFLASIVLLNLVSAQYFDLEYFLRNDIIKFVLIFFFVFALVVFALTRTVFRENVPIAVVIAFVIAFFASSFLFKSRYLSGFFEDDLIGMIAAIIFIFVFVLVSWLGWKYFRCAGLLGWWIISWFFLRAIDARDYISRGEIGDILLYLYDAYTNRVVIYILAILFLICMLRRMGLFGVTPGSTPTPGPFRPHQPRPVPPYQPRPTPPRPQENQPHHPRPQENQQGGGLLPVHYTGVREGEEKRNQPANRSMIDSVVRQLSQEHHVNINEVYNILQQIIYQGVGGGRNEVLKGRENSVIKELIKRIWAFRVEREKGERKEEMKEKREEEQRKLLPAPEDRDTRKDKRNEGDGKMREAERQKEKIRPRARFVCYVNRKLATEGYKYNLREGPATVTVLNDGGGNLTFQVVGSKFLEISKISKKILSAKESSSFTVSLGRKYSNLESVDQLKGKRLAVVIMAYPGKGSRLETVGGWRGVKERHNVRIVVDFFIR